MIDKFERVFWMKVVLEYKAYVYLWFFLVLESQPFKLQPHEMLKHTQTIRRQFVDELFECV